MRGTASCLVRSVIWRGIVFALHLRRRLGTVTLRWLRSCTLVLLAPAFVPFAGLNLSIRAAFVIDVSCNFTFVPAVILLRSNECLNPCIVASGCSRRGVRVAMPHVSASVFHYGFADIFAIPHCLADQCVLADVVRASWLKSRHLAKISMQASV